MEPDIANEVFFELHGGLEQQGPGSDASTRAAFERLQGLGPAPDILDLGCGPGRQTLALAGLTRGRVVAVDLLEPFLDQLREAVARAGLGDRVEVRQASMDDLPFEDESFDVIWSEGAIYNIGFERGLTLWKRLIRPGGWIAVSELSWLGDERPQSVADFWTAEYPPMQSVADNRAVIERLGYEYGGDFVLPESDWWTGYYDELEARIARMRAETSDSARLAALHEHQREIDAFRESDGSLGYVFYLMRRR